MRKTIILLLLTILWCGRVWATPAFVQATSNCSFGGTNNTTVTVGGSAATTCPTATGWTSNVTAGNLLAGFIWRKTGSATLNSVADGGDTCTAVNTAGTVGTSALYLVYGFYCVNIAGGVKPTITGTFSNSEDTWYVAAQEISGIVTSSPLDGSAFVGQAFVGAATNAGTTGNWTTSTNGDFVLGGFVDDGQNGRTITAGTSSQAWSALLPLDNTHVESMFTEGGVQTTASASTVIAFTTSAGTNPLLGAMAFKAASGTVPSATMLPKTTSFPVTTVF